MKLNIFEKSAIALALVIGATLISAQAPINPPTSSPTFSGTATFPDSSKWTTTGLYGPSNVMSIRNSTNAQTLDIYGTYTNTTNYERLRIGLSGGVYGIDSSGLGTGSNRTVRFLSGGVVLLDVVPSTSGIILGGSLAGNIATKTGTSYTVAATDYSLIINASGAFTLTLPSAATFSGRVLYLRSIAAQTVSSASSNVVPLAGGAAGTAILAATAGKWAVLQSDGTNWQISAAN